MSKRNLSLRKFEFKSRQTTTNCDDPFSRKTRRDSTRARIRKAKNLERAEHPRGQYPRRKTHARSIARHPSSVIYEQHPEKEKRSKRARPSVARVVKRYPPPSFTRCKCRPLEQPSQPHHQLGHRPTDPPCLFSSSPRTNANSWREHASKPQSSKITDLCRNLAELSILHSPRN